MKIDEIGSVIGPNIDKTVLVAYADGRTGIYSYIQWGDAGRPRALTMRSRAFSSEWAWEF